jgi:hypothetical protein
VDTSDHREELFELSVRDLLKVTRNLVESSDSKDGKGEISTLQDLNAIAATLHFVNLAQSGALRALPGTPEITLVDLLEKGLKAKDLLDSGKLDESELKGFEREVIHNETLAVYLLRSRQNFLKSLAFLLMSPQAQPSKSKPGITLKKEDLLEQSWTPDFKEKTSAQIQYVAIIIEHSARTRTLLLSLGYDPKDEPSVQTLLTHLSLEELPIHDRDPQRQAALERFKNAILLL